MDWSRECAAVIPCRDEAETIGRLVTEVRRHLPQVIVVNDGSRDTTASEAAAAGADLVRLERSRGKGSALRAGWQHAAERGFAWALSMDGDGQHAPADIPKFFEGAEQAKATLVVGNRMHAATAMPPARRFVNRWMSRKLSRLSGRELPDSQCGFRLARLDVLARFRLSAEHFEIESEQVLAFAAAGERIEFVPIEVIYRAERSKIRPLRDTLRWFRWLRQWQRAHPSGRAG